MKRFLYFVALVCLAGLGFCLMHLYGYTQKVGDTIDAAKDGDRSAIADLKDPTSFQGDGEEWLSRAAVFFVGLGVSGFLAKRAR